MQKKNTPVFSDNDVKNWVRDLYNLKVSVKPLVSYCDWNFLVTTEDQEKQRFIFKIANSDEPLNSLELQNQTMDFLVANNHEINCPKVCKSTEGKCITRISSPSGSYHYVRLLSYLPGTFMAHLDKKDYSPDLLENFGRFLGSMDNSLSNFSNTTPGYAVDWDLKNFMVMEDRLSAVTDHDQRRTVHYFLQLFKTEVLPKLSHLRFSTIHNDANDYNVLTGINAAGQREISGIIDFGDMAYTITLNELAVAVAYVVHGQTDLLETAAHVVKGYHQKYPLKKLETDLLYYLIGARLSLTLIMSAYTLKLSPENDYLNVSVPPAWTALQKLTAINPDLAASRFRAACDLPVESDGLEPDHILELRQNHLGKSLSISYKEPLKITRGFMQYLYDHTGRAYLDTVNNVCHVGHCHPRVVAAGQAQMGKLNTNTRYLHDNIVQYAQELCATLPDPLKVCFFVNSGSEANELALRMARIYSSNTDFVVVDHAYHGNTNAVIEISPYKFNGPGGKGPAPHIHTAMMPDPYRGPFKKDDAGEKYAADVERTFKKLEAAGRKAAAFIHESIPGVGGQIVFPDNYLKHAYKAARKYGAVCIADEVQIGFGRVGTHMWAFETQGVVPDIVTMGKPIGNGHPLAAVVTTLEIADAFNNGMEYFNTFGGNPVSCAIGKAVLDVIKEDQLQQNAQETGAYMKAGLEDLMPRYPLLGDVRGMGLFIGIELVKDDLLTPAKIETYYIADRMKEEGILVSVDGPLYNVLKIKPPIVFNKENADHYIDTLDIILKESIPG